LEVSSRPACVSHAQTQDGALFNNIILAGLGSVTKKTEGNIILVIDSSTAYSNAQAGSSPDEFALVINILH
jgi:hypothetical protein